MNLKYKSQDISRHYFINGMNNYYLYYKNGLPDGRDKNLNRIGIKFYGWEMPTQCFIYNEDDMGINIEKIVV